MFALALDIRDRLLKVLKDNGLSGQEFSVSAALLLGYVNDIDPGLKSAFAASGTMHILSVSGMHVGIIFIFLDTVLSFLDKLRFGRSMKCLTEILFIWSYAAVTGFSPAVLRSAASLSLLIAGKTIRRQPEMMNVLATSVFILLIAEPGLLTDVGFQLSYLAVIGIVMMYKPIYSLYHTRLWFPDKVWGLIAVSMAAQLSTFPLSLFYFHRFPNYFILSNLIIVPLSNGIIFMGITSLLLSPIPFAGKLSVAGLKFLVHLLNACVLWIEHLPGSVSKGFFPGIPDVLVIYMLIVSMCLFLMKKQQVFLLVVLVCIVILEALVVYGDYKGTKGYYLAIHKGSMGYVIRIIKGRKELCFNSDIKMMNDKNAGEQIMNERMAEKAGQVFTRWVGVSGWQKATGFGEVGRFGHMLVAKEKKVWLLDHDLSPGLRSGIHADIVLITADIHVDMECLSRIFRAGLVLNVSNASHRKVLKWADEAKRIRLDFYDLRTAGFYHEEI
jgi:competence protein ComEC